MPPLAMQAGGVRRRKARCASVYAAIGAGASSGEVSASAVPKVPAVTQLRPIGILSVSNFAFAFILAASALALVLAFATFISFTTPGVVLTHVRGIGSGATLSK